MNTSNPAQNAPHPAQNLAPNPAQNFATSLAPDPLIIGGETFSSRLFTGSGKFRSGETLRASLDASGASLVTVALKRVERDDREDPILDYIDRARYRLLPNTSGARNAKEAVFVAQMGREALETEWVKLEIHPDPKYLMPDPIETLLAAEQLVRLGFKVLPYIHADPVLCKRLEEVGVVGVMPLGAPIGSNQGLRTIDFLRIIIEQAAVPVIVDAGLGVPSHAAAAMELGADACLVNTAIAAAQDPVAMGRAFGMAIEAGRLAFRAGRAGELLQASASSPIAGFLADLE